MTASTPLKAGEKKSLDTQTLSVTVTHDLPDLDVSAFLLDNDRKMAGDESVVFYNNP